MLFAAKQVVFTGVCQKTTTVGGYKSEVVNCEMLTYFKML